MGGGTLDKDKVIKDNFREFSDGKFVTTERERECLCDYNSPTQPPFIEETR